MLGQRWREPARRGCRRFGEPETETENRAQQDDREWEVREQPERRLVRSRCPRSTISRQVLDDQGENASERDCPDDGEPNH